MSEAIMRLILCMANYYTLLAKLCCKDVKYGMIYTGQLIVFSMILVNVASEH